MTNEEAAWFLATIAAPYPGEPFTDAAKEVWYHSSLHAVDFDDCMELAEKLIESEEFRPTPAVFNRELRTSRQHERIAAPGREVLALEPAPAVPSKVATIIADLRATLASQGARKHWHGGKEPCPVCGGHLPT